MLIESFIAATETVKPPVAHLGSNLKDVGIFQHEFQPQLALRQGFKKSSIARNCLAISDTHIFAAQVGKAVVHVYNRSKANQEATVPFPQKISSLTYAKNSAILILGTLDGRLILWEVATGRVTNSSASHIEPITHLAITNSGEHILSASPDSSIHVWSLRELVSIGQHQPYLNGTPPKDGPLFTFSQHRSSIQTLAIGHSQHEETNFVVSASEDKTCYVWHLGTQQVLRTILLTQEPQCAIIDPGDRAIYIGCSNGGIEQISVMPQESSSKTSILSNSSQMAHNAIQLHPDDCFSFTSGDVGPAQCIALGYDGTRLLTGHSSGKILQWDVAKRKQTGDIPNLSGQSVTNISMLFPDGFDDASLTCAVPLVIKPRLELSTSSGTLSADYTCNVQVMHQPIDKAPCEFNMSLFQDKIPQEILDTAVQALARNRISNKTQRVPAAQGLSTVELYEIDVLKQKVQALESQQEARQEQDHERLDRHLERMRKRDAIGLEKRKAFFAAKKADKNGDESMASYTQQLERIDAESDDEALANSYGSDMNGKYIDVEMKG